MEDVPALFVVSAQETLVWLWFFQVPGVLRYVADHTCTVCSVGCPPGSSTVLPQPHHHKSHFVALATQNSTQIEQIEQISYAFVSEKT